MTDDVKLTDKQQMFIKEYLIDLNATQAAIRAGYSKRTAQQQGSENLLKPVIQSAIQQAMNKRAEKLDTSAEKVIEDLGLLRDMCMGRIPVKRTILTDDGDGGKIPIEVEATLFEPSAAKGAIELLGKHHKLFTDKVELVDRTELESRLQRAKDRIAEYRRKSS